MSLRVLFSRSYEKKFPLVCNMDISRRSIVEKDIFIFYIFVLTEQSNSRVKTAQYCIKKQF